MPAGRIPRAVRGFRPAQMCTRLDLCMARLHSGRSENHHIFPILTDAPRRGSNCAARGCYTRRVTCLGRFESGISREKQSRRSHHPTRCRSGAALDACAHRVSPDPWPTRGRQSVADRKRAWSENAVVWHLGNAVARDGPRRRRCHRPAAGAAKATPGAGAGQSFPGSASRRALDKRGRPRTEASPNRTRLRVLRREMYMTHTWPLQRGCPRRGNPCTVRSTLHLLTHLPSRSALSKPAPAHMNAVVTGAPTTSVVFPLRQQLSPKTFAALRGTLVMMIIILIVAIMLLLLLLSLLLLVLLPLLFALLVLLL